MKKASKTYITDRKEIDRLVAEALYYTRTHKGPAVLRGIRFPKGYRVDRLFGELGNTVRFVDCDLRGADFSGCDFDGFSERSKLYKQLDKTIPMACPATGKYTAYKRLAIGWIAKLEIPAHAKRSSATNKGKCRASEAVVKRIYRRFADGSVFTATEGESIRGRFRYVVGETVKPDGFDTNRFHVCAPGIHHFMTCKEAEDYK